MNRKQNLKLLILLSISLGLFLFFGWQASLFSLIFLFLLFFHPKRIKIPFIFSSLFFLICPFLILYKKEEWGVNLALWAFYFLLIGAFLLLINYWRKSDEDYNE